MNMLDGNTSSLSLHERNESRLDALERDWDASAEKAEAENKAVEFAHNLIRDELQLRELITGYNLPDMSKQLARIFREADQGWAGDPIANAAVYEAISQMRIFHYTKAHDVHAHQIIEDEHDRYMEGP